MNEKYAPDRWIVLNVDTDEGQVTRVFVGNYGGYGGSDDWRLSSAVENITDIEDRIEFTSRSGNIYVCYKSRYGTSIYMTNILEYWKEKGVNFSISSEYNHLLEYEDN